MDASSDPEAARVMGVRGTPWSIVVGRDGRLVFGDWTPEPAKLREVVERALAKKP